MIKSIKIEEVMKIENYTIESLKDMHEGQYFDRKSARMKPKDAVKHIIAFANADGGSLVIGIEDNGDLSGTNYQGAHTLEDYKLAIQQDILGQPCVSYEYIDYLMEGQEDRLFLIRVELSVDRLIKSRNEEVYLRIGDKSVKQTYSQIRQLEYAKGERLFEDNLVAEANITDLDEQLLNEYKRHLNCSDLSHRQVLEARGFMQQGQLTVAAILMFAENPSYYFPQARLRFLRYEGARRETGVRMNIVKDQTFDGPIPEIIRQAQVAVNAQLREFQFLGEDGRFKIVPEYPEFAWFEGIVNAVAHRDYSFRGDYIRISMFDDRLEIFSPGSLPNIVTLDNMRYTRYARNPRIARALVSFGWVRELNEGVNRIYDEMADFYLNEPEYSQPHPHALLLKLENNYLSRQMRMDDRVGDLEKKLITDEFNENERKILAYLYGNGRITVKKASEIIEMSDATARKLLRALVDKEVLCWHGNSKRDPRQYYTLISE
ncbi:ATP-binding protein [Aerococcus urinae]|uniref:DNA binding domain-containing protein n=2 Tax=Aerococcus urinae TaxID=1376 RepID=A0ABT4C695_9LACT|nr:ATP-binding protein [Aerococcus urinae]MCY3031796.1 putative DNA binding domain-containing protein [Aerococcus urinae]MCY3037210.1 putative DNA binding domain-containing protein [Aerococcus urinae]MCY3043843.1 putative DNA binding domain-containing protein [Aerococcus urinae]MCY3046512.1 putative DNA binding domain-containing protein [Aerococcus urinae]MCY3049239.1 putative DNA binding domain-containing protein [Aerococcus urinae]